MKQLFIILLAACAALPLSAARDNEKLVPSHIRQVTVYLNGAQVNRQAKVSVPSGTTSLVFSGLASTIDKNRIQVGISEPVVITSVAYRNNTTRYQMRSARLDVLEDSLELLDNMLAELNSLSEVMRQEENIILSNKSIGGAQTGVKISELKEGVAYMSARLAAIKKELLQNGIKQKNITLIRTRVANDINTQRADMSKISYEIIVEVNSPRETEADVDLTYMVGSANWSPRYDIRAKDVQSPIELVYRADISQQTGEDWKNVKLILSTGNPNISANKPVLTVNEVNQFNTFTNQSQLGYNAPAQVYTWDANTKKEKAAVTLRDFNLSINNVLSTLFEIGLPANVPSEAGSQNIEVQKYSLKSTYEYMAVPKLDRDAFLTARVTGWEELSLLGGSANVFFANAFIGETYINPSTIKDTLDISLGRDRKIVIKRDKVKDLCTSTLSGGNRKEQYTYEITVKNFKDIPVEVVVEDQIPVSRDSEVDVDLKDKGNAVFDPVTGKLRWVIRLEPGAASKVQFSFNIKYPKERVIMGL